MLSVNNSKATLNITFLPPLERRLRGKQQATRSAHCLKTQQHHAYPAVQQFEPFPDQNAKRAHPQQQLRHSDQ